jgi:uncharacterized membrane protein YdjX (TVP38/TMEM64 family)
MEVHTTNGEQDHNDDKHHDQEINTKIQELIAEHNRTKQKSKLILGSVFLVAVAIFALLVWKMPAVSSADRDTFLSFPDSPEKFAATKAVIRKYADQNFAYVLTLFVYLYILLQSFAIPGPVFLSIISGSLWDFYFSLFISSMSATIGATICYLLSLMLFKGWILKLWPTKIVTFMRKVKEHQHNLFFYMISIRLNPLFPNIMVNLSSPVAGVPLYIYFPATFIGLMPLNIIHVNTGATIDDINNVGLRPKHLLILLGLAGVAVLPTLWKKRRHHQHHHVKKEE